jgi:hypothetical protein
VSGSEIGAQMLFPANSFEHDFTYAAPHPIAETYRTFSVEQTFAISGLLTSTYGLGGGSKLMSRGRSK